MRLRLLAFVFLVLSVPFAGSALGQTPEQPAQRGDGGLHVSNGGVVGYVGGSGSISGNVVGPGGPGGGSTKPAVSDAEPNAATEGKVAPLQETKSKADTTPARSSNNGSMVFIGIAVLIGGALLLFSAKRRPRTA